MHNMIHVYPADQLPEGLSSPDVYFTAGYGRAACITEGGEWLLLEAFDGAWQVPLIVRTLIDGTKDAITSIYSGVYAAPLLSSVQIQEAWSATLTCLRELGIISVVLRGSPLVPQAPHGPGQRSIVIGNPTIVLEPADRDSAWSNMAGTCRTKIRKALKNGYTGEVRQAAGQDLAPGSDFRRLYEQTMQRLDAAPMYFFSDDYYSELLDGLGSNLLISEVRNPLGVVVTSGLLMRHGQRLHAHLGGSNMDDARMGSNNLLNWTEMQFTIDQGLSQFHIGAGHDQRDSLFKFKSSFGGRELAYDVTGLIINPKLYQAHVESRANECDTTSEALLASNYFPAYRAGIPHV
jgi:serine/alanine adding enzyme